MTIYSSSAAPAPEGTNSDEKYNLLSKSTGSALNNVSASKTRADKMHTYFGIISTGIGIIGAVGTGFVWIAANVFVSDVEIKPDKQVDAVLIRVTGNKGQQSMYYNKHVQLMPGEYHMEIGLPDQQPTKKLDLSVQLWKNVVIPYTVPIPTSTLMANASDSTNNATPGINQKAAAVDNSRKHWWQFWRKSYSSIEGQQQTSAPLRLTSDGIKR